MFSAVTVTGEDARRFLQGQLTRDLAAVSPACSPLAAWCSPKGRVIAVLRLLLRPDGYDLVLPAELAATVVAGLGRYRLRSRVELAESPAGFRALAVANPADLATLEARGLLPAARRDASAVSGDLVAVCPGRERSFVEVYGRSDAAAGLDVAAPLAAEDWQDARIEAGIADIGPATTERYTPHMLNLDRLSAVSFDKGCYTGQEIIARTEHRGSARRRAARFTSSAPVTVGEPVAQDGSEVGTVIAAGRRQVLALLPVELHSKSLAAGDARLAPAD